jgi:DNA replication and repair protein RecF
MLYRQTGERPVVLLDDVMSELDSGRQDYLLNHLDRCQVFITCCEPGAIQQLREGSLFEMDGGTLIKK